MPRAVKRSPLTYMEIEKRFDLKSALEHGTPPQVLNLKTPEEKEDYLFSYAQTYLKEEIQQEALTRNLTSYTRFLKHLSLMNGHILNLSNIARESGVKRAPLENYMSILQDTLMGTTIDPLHLQAKIKEVSTPKFYFFDCGIVHALKGDFGEDSAQNLGLLFETLVLNELRAYANLSRKPIEINYWGTPSGNEVDFILSKGQTRVGIDVKYSTKWKSEFKKGLEILLTTKKIKSGFIVYAGEHIEKHENILLLPFSVFCKKLFSGELF